MDAATKKDLTRKFWNYLGAYTLVAMSASLGVVLNGIIVGNMVNEHAVSALNLARSPIQLFFSFNLLFGIGGGMLVGKSMGEKNIEQARSLFTQSLTIVMTIALCFSFTGIFFSDAITHFICADEGLYAMAKDYTRVLFIGAPAYMMMWGLSIMVGVDGSPKLVSVAILVDNAVNLLLCVLFIAAFDWGVAGSSRATVCGHLVGIAIMLTHFRRPRARLRLVALPKRLHDFAFWRILSQGAPLAVASICLTVLFYVANTLVMDTLGSIGIFAFSVCMNLLMIYNLFLSGTVETLQSLGSIQVGEGNEEVLRFTLKQAFSFITTTIIITCLVIWIIPEQIASLFGANEPAMIAETARALRIFSLSFIPFCYTYTLMIVYKLYGQHKMALFISFAMSSTIIPVFWLMARYAPQWLWYSYLIAYIIEIVAIVIMHHLTHAKFKL